MYEDTACFDPNSTQEGVASNCFSQTDPNINPNFTMEEFSQTELQHQLGMNIEQSYSGTHLIQEEVINSDPNQVSAYDHHHSNWGTTIQEIQNLQNFETPNGDHHQILNSSLPNTPYPPTPDLLNLFHLSSRQSLLLNSSISFSNSNHRSANFPDVLYDPLLHLNLPPQPPLFRDLLQNLPHGYNSLFGGVDERENGVLYQEGDGRQFDNGVLEFNRDMNGIIVEGRDSSRNDTPKHFATERQRRVHLNDKYKVLRCLVPNPTKTDRASIVGDAIEYIKELLRTVNELKILVEKKRCGRERRKRHKTEDQDDHASGDMKNLNMKPLLGDDHPDQSYNGDSTLMRSSWLQRKSKEIEVDVSIVHDEVNIKMVQRKINCLLLVSKVLDELQLDLHHVAGGHIGDYYSFLFNTKICDGSSVYASAIANKLIEVVDRHSQCSYSTN